MKKKCNFKMKVTGTKGNVQELLEMISWTGKYQNKGWKGIYECRQYDYKNLKKGLVTAFIEGECITSVRQTFCSMKDNNLDIQSCRLSLVIEVKGVSDGVLESFFISHGKTYIEEEEPHYGSKQLKDDVQWLF